MTTPTTLTEGAVEGAVEVERWKERWEDRNARRGLPLPALKRLPADLKAKWVAALRSGNYHQLKPEADTDNRSGLRAKVNGQIRYCCLGLLCNVRGNRKGWSERTGEIGASNRFPGIAYDWTGGPAGSGVTIFAALDFEGLKDVLDLEAARFLAERNDGRLGSEGEGWDFNQIADWVEVNL